MRIYDYTTAGGKNLILSYIDDLSAPEKAKIYKEVTKWLLYRQILRKKKKELEKLITTDASARKAYEELQAKVALQKQLVRVRKAENLTQTEVAHAAGISQQAVSRIEKGTGATINSLI